MSPPMEVNKSVKGSSDTARLHKKFEKKLSELVTPTTPDNLKDAMQDIVIESSRILSENFVSRNYKALVKDAMIAELQKRGSAIVIDRNGLTENAFFVAQRLKQTDSIDPVEPVQANISSIVAKNLEDIIRCHSMARKLSGTMKDHIKSVADYLSAFVTKPDEKIEAYVAMLEEMDKLDKELLIEESITKSFKDAAAYLRTLISNVDQINLSNASLKSTIVSKITNVMSQSGRDKNYAPAVLSGVIENSAQMLVSYVMLQGEKTEALQFLILQMDVMPDALLLRHGEIRKSNGDGANLLRGKNTDQLAVTNVDPVVARKIQIKVNTLMPTTIPDKFQRIMNEVISDATKYLAVHLLLPEVVKVCKCMKNVFVQCELWCEEIVRRVSQPCCTCSRQVSAKALSNLVLDERVRAAISGPGASAGPHIDIEIRPCPAAQSRSRHEPHGVCPGSNPTSGCRTKASYMLYSTEYNHQRQYVEGPTRLPRPAADSYNSDARLRGPTSECPSDHLSDLFGGSPAGSSPSEDGCHVSSRTSGMSYYTPTNKMLDESQSTESSMSPSTTMHAQIWPEYSRFAPSMKEVGPGVPKYTIGKEAYRNRAPIVATDQKEDWQAMMVSLMWNVQGWRNWIQETIDRALVSRSSSDDVTVAIGEENWSVFCRRIETEALQWREYNIYSRQLALRLALRYRDKQIVSPTRASLKTGLYMQCQNEMLDIINMFNRWTHWLSVIIKDSDTMQCPSSADGDTRWSYFKNKVEEYADDWIKYNMHLKVCWEHKYTTVMKDWVPTWSEPRPVWVMSTGGAVPSGAVAAGAADGEPTWVARITHDALVLPAALQPSKQCCVLYADGAIHHYNKYQVLCNAEVLWMPWRASWMSARAVRVAPAVYVGRVLYRGAHLVGAVLAPNYRCHVIIFGRPFAFNCYELLVLAELC